MDRSSLIHGVATVPRDEWREILLRQFRGKPGARVVISRTTAATGLFPVQSQERDGARKPQAVSGTAAQEQMFQFHEVAGASAASVGVGRLMEKKKKKSSNSAFIRRGFDAAVATALAVAGDDKGVCARLTWSDLWVSVTDAKGEDQTVLHGLSGYAEPGGMLAILGPSGSGQCKWIEIKSPA